MIALKAWFISGAAHLAVGFVVGWLFVKRPQWVTDLIAKAKAKLVSIKFW